MYPSSLLNRTFHRRNKRKYQYGCVRLHSMCFLLRQKFSRGNHNKIGYMERILISGIFIFIRLYRKWGYYKGKLGILEKRTDSFGYCIDFHFPENIIRNSIPLAWYNVYCCKIALEIFQNSNKIFLYIQKHVSADNFK